MLHNVELKSGKGGAIARRAGTYVQIVVATRKTSRVGQDSVGEHSAHAMGSVSPRSAGVGNPDYMGSSIGKAGRTRWLGKSSARCAAS